VKNPSKDPRFTAAIDVLRRTGAQEVQIRFSDDEEPTIWMAVAGYAVRNGRPTRTGKINAYETAAGVDPTTAVFRLCAQLCDGGLCYHCQRMVGFSPEPGAIPEDPDNPVCWWIWDPEVNKFVQGCQL
jgi:hypothetical protein